MSPISTHVLDLSRGRPAAGMSVTLEHRGPGGAWRILGHAETDDDGRASDLLPNGHSLLPGRYRLVFDTEAYFRNLGVESFFSGVSVPFHVRDTADHYHVPLLLADFGYSTYRGS